MKTPKKTMKKQTLPLLTLLLLAACGNPPQDTPPPPPPMDTTAAVPTERPDVVAPSDATIKLVAAPPATQFPDADLKLDTLIPNNKKMDAEYKFTVNGFELKAQTPDAGTRGCANSKDGQHIHFILNNAPYKAEYNSDFTEKANPGRNVALCFLSRSYHESLKNNKAVVVKEFTMPGKDSLIAGDVTKDPTLFYSPNSRKTHHARQNSLGIFSWHWPLLYH